MSQVYCWECENSYARNEVFDVPVFRRGYTIKWCLNCAMKQLEWTDYRLIPKPKKYKRFRILSVEDDGKEWEKIRDELVLCYESQFSKLPEITFIWGGLHNLVSEIQDGDEE